MRGLVLLIGAGDVGSEVLKNLVLSSFSNIEIIDQDTIEISNFNRQLFFHKEHVRKSKVQVAKTSALSINPIVNIVAHHDSVHNKKYGVDYYKRFSIVINALDSRVARKHVNRMCLAADIPLIETGTAGYAGQVEIFKKGVSQCYECQPEAVQKSFTSRTILNTPSELMHCIVWAKHLFNQLFGERDPDEEVSPDLTDPEAAGGSAEYAPIVSTRALAEDTDYDTECIFAKLFGGDIRNLVSKEKLWDTRQLPSPLLWDDLPGSEEPPAEDSDLSDQRVWSIHECAQVFAESVKALQEQMLARPAGNYLVWDKDEKQAMDFVTATANVRAHVFGIPTTSRFEIKAMAGNIIPTSASANAIVAGLAVLRVLAILKGDIETCTSVYLRSKVNHRGQLIVPEKTLKSPNPKCYVCPPVRAVTLVCDLNKFKLKNLYAALKEDLNILSPDAIVEEETILSSEEGETNHNNEKTLNELGLTNGCIFLVDDFVQSCEVRVRLQNDEDEVSWRFVTIERVPGKGQEPKDGEKPSTISNGVPQPGTSRSRMDAESDLETTEDEDYETGSNLPKVRRVNDK